MNGAAVVLMLDSPISKRAKYTVNGVPFEVGPGQTVTVTVHKVKT